jgi:hypothetical protein
MKKITIKLSLWTTVLLLFVYTSNAQVGIGTASPDLSSMLDVSSTSKGFLTPRMITAERLAITTPADGLIVYDLTLKSFYYYNAGTSLWTVINSGANGRLNFKRIKSTDVLATVLATELSNGGGTKYLLDTATLYEINGTVNFTLPIDLNNAYISGLDANEDKLTRSNGSLFVGATGGGIRNVTITVTGGVGNLVFDLSGASTQSLIFRDSVVAGCSNVGTVNGFGLVFFAIVQYVGNTTGITYNNITRVLLSNTAWFSGNQGTFEKFTGTFTLLQKQGGFCEVVAGATGVDVSGNPTITGDAVMETVVFTGAGTYVNKYTLGSYTGYNFNNKWSIRCAGIPAEVDAVATGNLYKTSNTTPTTTTATTLNSPYKVVTTATAATNLFRFDSATTARLTYKGKKPRAFQASASISFQETTSSGTNVDYVFYFVKVGTDGTTITALPETETYVDTNSGFIQAFPITGTILLVENESVELYLKRVTNGTKINIQAFSYNLSLK